MQVGRGERILWVVERPDFVDFLSEVFSMKLGPSVDIRSFCRPERALDALRTNEGAPDLLITAFYFDGGCKSGLMLVQEARKIHPSLLTVVISGFPLQHLKGIAADWPVQPDLLFQKPGEIVEQWIPALKVLLAQPSGAGLRQPGILNTPVAFTDEAGVELGPQPHRHAGRPLVWFAGGYDCLNTLKRCMGRNTQPHRFQGGYDWEHFKRPEDAWARLEEVGNKPEALVTDYFFEGGYLNGLKLVRHAQKVVPGIWTVLAGDVTEAHIQGIMKGTGISPDLFFHYDHYCSPYHSG